MTSIPPTILWAQRSSEEDAAKNIIYLTIRVIDPVNTKLELTATHLNFSASAEGKSYELSLEFFNEIDAEKSKHITTGSHLSFILQKKELGTEYWPRLTKQKLKYHYIHTDFDKWVDEDEQDDVNDEDLAGAGDMSDMGGAMGGMPGMGGAMGGMPGMGGAMGGMPGMGDMASMMGGMGGMGGPGGFDFSQLAGMGGAGPDGKFDITQLASQLGNAAGAVDNGELSSSDEEEEAK